MNYVGMPIIFEKDHPVYSNDLSMMSEEDWEALKKAQNEYWEKASPRKSEDNT